MNNPHPHEVLPSNQKIKPSKLKSPSNAFQSRHRLSLSNNPDEIRKLLLTDDALIEIMSNTLKHAASSMFVTSFTTSAAFFTNILTNISFVQVFGVFTGTCILLYFIITVTAIAAFAVSRNKFHRSSEKFLFLFQIIYEKYLQNLLTRIFSIRTSSTKFCRRFASICKDIRNYIFGHLIPSIIINLRYVLVLLFLLLGISGSFSFQVICILCIDFSSR